MGKHAIKEPTQRQLDFVKWYTSPASPTYDNVVQSAIRAGYSEGYANSTAYRVLKPIAKRLVLNKRTKETEKTVEKADFYRDLLDTAEQNIERDLNIKDTADIKERQLKQKSTHFTAERLGRDRWSTKKVVENQGLFTLNDKALESLANVVQGAISAPVEPIHADYTVKSDDLIAEKAKDDEPNA